MIPFICNLPIIGSCFKSDETHRKSSKKPIQIKTVKIKEITTLIKKIMLAALILFICISGFMLNRPTPINTNNITCPQIPSYLCPYTRQIAPKIFPNQLKPIASLPPSFHPDKTYGENGRVCILSNKRPAFEDCFKVNAYQEAFFYIEKEIMSDPDFFEKDADTIVAFIKNSNAFITKYLNDPGSLRDQQPLLLEINTVISRKGLKKAFYKRGGTDSDIKTFHSLYDKLEKYDILDKALYHLTEDELRVLKIIGFLPCHPDEVDSKLYQLACQMKEMAIDVKEQKTDTIASAAYVHQKLVKISPFMHGNKGTARLWMYVILQLGGFEAFTMQEEEYEWEISKDLKSSGSFTTYLKQVVQSTRKRSNIKPKNT